MEKFIITVTCQQIRHLKLMLDYKKHYDTIAFLLVGKSWPR